ncbi:MAG: hypothetical protein RBG13Loki_1790 [Promethearchaeota archaeon CR_4]|nr:MAG: hypothetical protein RBG13Loki_1790 [Candidatus Lokiarchaeota archaeon CR_4]
MDHRNLTGYPSRAVTNVFVPLASPDCGTIPDVEPVRQDSVPINRWTWIPVGIAWSACTQANEAK